MDLTPAERRHIRVIRSQLDLYERQAQPHVAGLIAQQANELYETASRAADQRNAESAARATESLKAFEGGAS